MMTQRFPEPCLSRPFLVALAALAALLTASCTDVTPAEPGRNVIELDVPEGDRPPAPDDEGDPSPAMLDAANAAVMRTLATTLSQEREWLTPLVLDALARRAVDLDEVFVDAPHLVAVEDARFVVQLEAVGRWNDFDAGVDPFAVALSAEIVEPFAADTVVALVAGEEQMVAEPDLQHLPVVFVTLAAPTVDSTGEDTAPALARGLRVRSVRDVNELPRDRAAREAVASRRRAACGAVAPSCDASGLVCPSQTEPFLLMTEIRVNDDHEPWLRGAPEIEAFVVRMDESTGEGGSAGLASTTAIFDGAVHTDALGRERLLPDVNDSATWYPIDGGFALFPYALGDVWAVTGVEDDVEKGVWRAKGESINWIALFETIFSAVSAYEELQYLELLQDLLTLFDMIRDAVDTDDMLQPAIGVDRDLFDDELCTGGTSWDTVLSLGGSAADLEIRGHFACLPAGDICP